MIEPGSLVMWTWGDEEQSNLPLLGEFALGGPQDPTFLLGRVVERRRSDCWLVHLHYWDREPTNGVHVIKPEPDLVLLPELVYLTPSWPLVEE